MPKRNGGRNGPKSIPLGDVTEQIAQAKGRVRVKGPWDKPCQFGDHYYSEGEREEHLKVCPAYQAANKIAGLNRSTPKSNSPHSMISDESLPSVFSEQFSDSEGRLLEWGAFYFRFAASNRKAVREAYDRVRDSFYSEQEKASPLVARGAS